MSRQPFSISQQLENEFEEKIGPISQALADEMHLPHNALLPPQAHPKKIEYQLREQNKILCRKCTEGLKFCLEALQELASRDPSIQLARLKDNLQAALSKIDSLDTALEMGAAVYQGKTWAEVLDIKITSLMTLSSGALHLFSLKRYSETEAAFTLLAHLDGSYYPFWMSLGIAKFYCKSYEEAIQAFEKAISLDPTAALPHWYAATCCEALSNFDSALMELEKAKQLAYESLEQDRDLQDMIQENIIALKNKRGR